MSSSEQPLQNNLYPCSPLPMTTDRFLAPRRPIPSPYPPAYHQPILFHHPACPVRRGVLFTLPRVDPTRNPDRPRGVHHGTALLACQIVANNSFNGRLYTDRLGQRLVRISLDGVLEEDNYFFMIDDNYRLQYAIVPTFRDWVFPHGGLPDSWYPPAANANDQRDSKGCRCALSDNYEGVKRAYIVPREEEGWFQRQLMGEFYTGGVGIHSDPNRMWLRADLHRLYDAHNFAIVPKREIFDPGEPHPHPQAYVVHFLGAPVGEFWDGYHNVPVQHIECTRPQLHLARFAWAILIRVKGFLLKGCPRTVVRVLAEDGEQKTETLAGSDLRELYGDGGCLYASPTNPTKKRKGDGDMGEGEEGEEPDEEGNGPRAVYVGSSLHRGSLGHWG